MSIDYTTSCKLCGLKRPMVFQCYAPLENSAYHRTLYIFACINPNCWNKSESWSCLRIQHKDKVVNEISMEQSASKQIDPWCGDADDWDDTVNGNDAACTKPDDAMDDLVNYTENMSCSNARSRLHGKLNVLYSTTLFKSSIIELKEKMEAFASAEIETDESIQVVAETLEAPQCDMKAIYNERPDLPDEIKSEKNVQFSAMYVAVYGEYISDEMDDHVADLLQRYRRENEDPDALSNPCN
jgi:pre-rRNA-processing protein TSR4